MASRKPLTRSRIAEEARSAFSTPMRLCPSADEMARQLARRLDVVDHHRIGDDPLQPAVAEHQRQAAGDEVG